LVLIITVHRVLELMSREGGPQSGQLLTDFQPPDIMAAPVQRSATPRGCLPALAVNANGACRSPTTSIILHYKLSCPPSVQNVSKMQVCMQKMPLSTKLRFSEIDVIGDS
jgi:hypothetical protein